MSTSGNKGARRKLPTAATQSIPTAPATPVEPMTAEEAAPAIEAAHDAADIAAAPLVAPADLAPAPVTIETTPATVAEDKTMDVNATIQNTADNTTDKAKAMFADVQDRTKGAVEKGQQFLAELTEFNKGNIEALVESSKIAARGFESMSQDAMATAKSSFEDASQAMQTFATVKSPTEFMKLQADFARSAFDMLVQQTSRRTEASLKLAGEIAQPISNRVAIAAEKIKIAA
ncbi:phasin family protein [Sphingomonas rubra]|uniref:Phasin family protein n=1 Tax=Sphingomonas rubra TaxID=634430 RepID=A0A1I5SDK3_9SPHN|nr:phasin family protein [Sphingomonas rubra]SFP68805.1 phasin family protein [Sphingomonas rubra]